MIKKKFVCKVFDMICKFVEEGGDVEDDDVKFEGEDDAATKDESKYEKFWKLFGKAIKFGIIEDVSNCVCFVKFF